MTMLASQITSLTVVYSIVYSGVNQRKHQSSASLAFVREIHRGPVNFPHKWPVTRKMFPFDDVIMCCVVLWLCYSSVITSFNTLRSWQNGHYFLNGIFKCIFLNGNVWISIRISLRFVCQGPFNNIPAMVQIMVCRRPSDKPLSGSMMVRLPTHIYVTRPRLLGLLNWKWVSWLNIKITWCYMQPWSPLISSSFCNKPSHLWGLLTSNLSTRDSIYSEQHSCHSTSTLILEALWVKNEIVSQISYRYMLLRGIFYILIQSRSMI